MLGLGRPGRDHRRDAGHRQLAHDQQDLRPVTRWRHDRRRIRRDDEPSAPQVFHPLRGRARTLPCDARGRRRDAGDPSSASPTPPSAPRAAEARPGRPRSAAVGRMSSAPPCERPPGGAPTASWAETWAPRQIAALMPLVLVIYYVLLKGLGAFRSNCCTTETTPQLPQRPERDQERHPRHDRDRRPGHVIAVPIGIGVPPSSWWDFSRPHRLASVPSASSSTS